MYICLFHGRKYVVFHVRLRVNPLNSEIVITRARISMKKKTCVFSLSTFHVSFLSNQLNDCLKTCTLLWFALAARIVDSLGRSGDFCCGSLLKKNRLPRGGKHLFVLRDHVI